MGIPQLHFRDIGRIVVAPSFCSAVTGKMFRTGYDPGPPAGVCIAETLQHGQSHFRDQEGVFTETFGHSSPTRVPGNVDHGRKIPVDAGSGCLHGSNMGTFAYQFRVEGCCQPDVYRENGFKAMNHIASEQKGYAKPAFLNSGPLQFPDHLRPGLIENGPHFTSGNQRQQILRQFTTRAVNQLQLADLLFQGHFSQELPGHFPRIIRITCR